MKLQDNFLSFDRMVYNTRMVVDEKKTCRVDGLNNVMESTASDEVSKCCVHLSEKI